MTVLFGNKTGKIINMDKMKIELRRDSYFLLM
jgi:hypothetical protein